LAAFQCAWPAENPAGRALQQHQLQRQQRDEDTQLRLMQLQRAAQTPPAGLRERQARERQQVDQRQRQQELHDRQAIEPAAAQPANDEGTRRAKAELELQRARQQSQQQIRQFEGELRRESGN
jgi:hypothetical protein